MTIVLDLDDVLANLREALYQTISRATGVDNHWQNWQHYDLTQHFDIGNDELERLIIEERILERCEPEPSAQTATAALAERGFTVAIVTARAWHPNGRDITKHWLTENRIHFDHLALVDLGGNKLQALTALDDVRFAVDDHPSNIKRYQQAGIPSLMMDMPWNGDYDATRIHSMDAVLSHADEILATAED